ncbi:MAG: hypothetical protein IKU37_08645 [Candidatus Gastranaerophilales bacterium]|nr:hypothetical protein [Candidatus Gastranaerophilales bacterium]
MNKELKNQYIENILQTTFKNSEKMKKYFESDITNVVQLSAGMMAFHKPHIKTSFCYSYDEVMDCHAGTDTYKQALKKCDVQAITFINDNLFDLNRQLKNLKESKIYFIKNYYNNDMAVKFVNQEYADRFPTDIYSEATDEDVEILIEAVKEEIVKFTKRLNTYLKKYGTSKLKTWTYSIND